VVSEDVEVPARKSNFTAGDCLHSIVSVVVKASVWNHLSSRLSFKTRPLTFMTRISVFSPCAAFASPREQSAAGNDDLLKDQESWADRGQLGKPGPLHPCFKRAATVHVA